MDYKCERFTTFMEVQSMRSPRRSANEQYDLIMECRSSGLSEGQAQRISIARALLRNAPVLLMDEATSALDMDTERKVLQNILQKAPRRTVIITTHRPTVLTMCDRVYRVVDGRIIRLEREEIKTLANGFRINQEPHTTDYS